MFIKFSYVEALKRIYLDGLKSQRHKTKVLGGVSPLQLRGIVAASCTFNKDWRRKAKEAGKMPALQ
jgi:hypothetical protein